MKSRPFSLILLILLIIVGLSANAEVTLDGTLGRTGRLPGPNYQIGADLGQQHGGNLFHSFSDFNLKSHESATFYGPNSVNNIISRVTGGNPSSIDGTLRSLIPKASVYFLNPYGIMFGPNAKLDVQGSFHASTADTLRLGTDGQFNARLPEQSLLTVAPPEAFGFLTDSPAAITVQDSQLSVSEGQTLSLIGGDLRLNASQADIDLFKPLDSKPQLLVESGRINLVSQADRGEFIMTDSEFHSIGGQITMNNAQISVMGNGGGDIFIRAGRLELVNSVLENHTLGDKDGGVIDILVDNVELQGSDKVSGIYAFTLGTGQGSTINLQAKQLTFNGSAIFNGTFGLGQSGPIHVKVADTLSILGQLIPSDENDTNDSGIFNYSANAGDVGAIQIEARQLVLKNGGIIANRALGSGNGGAITLKVTDAIIAFGENESGNSSGIIGSSGIQDNDNFANTGNAAPIDIEARQIRLSDGAKISSESAGLGTSGHLKIKVADSLTLEGQSQLGEPSNISASSASEYAEAGNAGRVEIEAREIVLTGGGAIQNATIGTGNGGPIILVTDSLTVSGGFEKPWTEPENETIEWLPSGIFTSTVSKEAPAGIAGLIELTARQIVLMDGGQINNETFGTGDAGAIDINVDTLTAKGNYIGDGRVFYSGVTSRSSQSQAGAGKAGNISIQANTINLTNDGLISTAAANAAGGNITLSTNHLLFLRQGQISTSVKGGSGNGGNITISHPTFVILNQGQIRANADEGRGGDIGITSDQFIASPCSQVSASSRLGVDGKVEIDAPETDLDDFLVVLPGDYVEPARLPKPCSIQEVFEPSMTFRVQTVREGMPVSPENFME